MDKYNILQRLLERGEISIQELLILADEEPEFKISYWDLISIPSEEIRPKYKSPIHKYEEFI